jgi:hypothetical protein
MDLCPKCGCRKPYYGKCPRCGFVERELGEEEKIRK